MMEQNCAIIGLDDDQDTIDLMARFFDKAGIVNYHFFLTKEEFIENFIDTVHIAIIDHYLGGTSVGFDIMKEIFDLNEKRGAIIRCKVIIISGQQDPKMIAYYLNKGAFRYVDKNDKNFFEQLVKFVKIAIKEVESFYESMERWKNRVDDIKSILDLNQQ